MFKKSLLLVICVLGVVMASAFTTQMVLSGQLPSAYDPGIQLMEAFQTAKTPVLIEFYSDDCTACRQVTPMLHEVYKRDYTDKLTLVMLDVNDPANTQAAQLFGITEIPAIYIFDAKGMKKTDVSLDDLGGPARIKDTLAKAIEENKNQKSRNNGRPPMLRPGMKRPISSTAVKSPTS